ncbi:hypothetical protein BGW36DRAFT_444501 [Talaromyces proteolyticus]|uniref:Uncharacterized protein n=1 Tax=Talaromyces proteolyticus TaxID=1131652 RepID=A0AAD4L3I2_9EURO|nr:uncharacterized protein BGW36DRAFT_444501 [Talaromyces proteolyticus]KAH8703944.1 hypothetical protein BGW36DRAFT_444501 [Talaromyces proteolyticus]
MLHVSRSAATFWLIYSTGWPTEGSIQTLNSSSKEPDCYCLCGAERGNNESTRKRNSCWARTYGWALIQALCFMSRLLIYLGVLMPPLLHTSITQQLVRISYNHYAPILNPRGLFLRLGNAWSASSYLVSKVSHFHISRFRDIVFCRLQRCTGLDLNFDLDLEPDPKADQAMARWAFWKGQNRCMFLLLFSYNQTPLIDPKSLKLEIAERCILTSDFEIAAAHIYPFAMVKKFNSRTELSDLRQLAVSWPLLKGCPQFDIVCKYLSRKSTFLLIHSDEKLFTDVDAKVNDGNSDNTVQSCHVAAICRSATQPGIRDTED